MTDKIDTTTRVALATTAMVATRRLGDWFDGRLTDRISPLVIERLANDWADGVYHGGVESEKRVGFALRKRRTSRMALGLLSAAHSRLRDKDVPTSRRDLDEMMAFLIVSPFNRTAGKDAAIARNVALKSLRTSAIDDGFMAHCDDLWSLIVEHPAIYDAFVLGDFVAAQPLVEAVDDQEERARLVVIGARQRIVWGLWDIHRASAASRDVTSRLIPWFLKPLTWGSNTSSAVFAAMLALSSSALRYFALRIRRNVTAGIGPR